MCGSRKKRFLGALLLSLMALVTACSPGGEPEPEGDGEEPTAETDGGEESGEI